MLELLNQLDGFDSGGDVKVGWFQVLGCINYTTLFFPGYNGNKSY